MFRSFIVPLTMFVTLAAVPNSATATMTCTDQVPTLTGNTSAVSTSGDFSSSYRGWEAFDSQINSSSMWISETWETPAWIAYNFGSNRVVNRYSINNTNGSLTSRAPKDFTLQGWNGSSWITVDTRTNQTGWVSGQAREYEVANPGNYSRYRLHITDDNDSRNGIVVISIGDLRFEYCSCSNPVDQVPTLTGNSSSVLTSGIFGSSYQAWEAFDASTAYSSSWLSELWETPAWIGYNFGSDRLVTQYQLRNSNGSLTSRAPKDFTLQGWNGSSWVTVDTRTNQTGWVSGTPRTYNVATPGYFSQYRVHITDDNDARSGVVVISLSDVQFRGCQGPGSGGALLNLNLQCLGTIEGDANTCLSTVTGGSSPYFYSWSYVGDGYMQSSSNTADVFIDDCTGGLNVISVTVTDSNGNSVSDDHLIQCQAGCPFGQICPL